MNIFVVGGGNVGAALGLGWLKAGHNVRFGVPDPSDSKYANLPKERLGPANDRRGAEIVVLAVPYGAAKAAVESLGDLNGAIVIDCTNPVGMGKQGLELLLGFDTSGAENVASWARGASVFKTLNQSGAENMGDASVFHPKAVMFVAGDDEKQKPRVMKLVADLGFESVDVGPLTGARLLEPLALLWIELAMQRLKVRDFAFAIVKKGSK